MAGKVIIANLPSTSEIRPQSFVIIEKPGEGDGTFKATVGDLQEAITCHATVTQTNNVTSIDISDINGETHETIVTPLAEVTNASNTITIRIEDVNGVTTQSIVVPTAEVTQSGQTITINTTDYRGSNSQSFFVPVTNVTRAGQTITIHLEDGSGVTEEDIVVPTATVTDNGDDTITIAMSDENGGTSATLVYPTASIVDNGDGTSTITITDAHGVSRSTVVSSITIDNVPTQGSYNFVTSGTIYTELANRDTTITNLSQALESAVHRIANLEAFSAVALVTETAPVYPYPGEGIAPAPEP